MISESFDCKKMSLSSFVIIPPDSVLVAMMPDRGLSCRRHSMGSSCSRRRRYRGRNLRRRARRCQSRSRRSPRQDVVKMEAEEGFLYVCAEKNSEKCVGESNFSVHILNGKPSKNHPAFLQHPVKPGEYCCVNCSVTQVCVVRKHTTTTKRWHYRPDGLTKNCCDTCRRREVWSTETKYLP